MGRKRRRDSSVVLPWERRGTWLRRPSTQKLKLALLALVAIVVFVGATSRERSKTTERVARNDLWHLHQGVDRYRIEHEGRCPSSLQELVKKHYLPRVPVDPWGSPYVFRCPGRFDPNSYDLSSAGPDKIPGGLDQIR